VYVSTDAPRAPRRRLHRTKNLKFLLYSAAVFCCWLMWAVIYMAGWWLRARTPPTFILFLLFRVSVGTSTLKLSLAPISVECLFPMTLLDGADEPAREPRDATQGVSQSLQPKKRPRPLLPRRTGLSAIHSYVDIALS